nr:uncharacterized protein LOC104109985 [Nicotiana tomentosiformis]
MPKFDLYDGYRDPVAHLRGFCSKMRGADGKDELLMYNIDIVPNRLSLTKVEKKPSESFREYEFRWREQAARVNLPMEEDEMDEYFLQALEPTYFGHLISAIGHNTKKCWHLKRAIQEFIDINQIMVQSPEAPNINQNPLPAYAETYMIEIVHKDGEPKNSSKSIMMIRASESNSVKAPDSAKAMFLTVEGVTGKVSMLNVKPPVLVVKGPPDNVGPSQEKPKVVVPWIPSKPVIVVEGARITPVVIKPVTQLPMVDTKDVLWNYKQVIVTYKGKEVEEEVNETGGMTHSGRCFTLEELRKAKPFKDSQILVKKSVTEEEAEEFLKKMKVQDYSIVEQLRKTPAQISLLSLLIHLDEHRRALMKILNEAHVPDNITVNHLEKIANKIFEANRITFSDDELSMEGTEHNRAFYLTVKCEEFVVSRVLVDNGSSANICPLSTLQKLKIGTERIHMISRSSHLRPFLAPADTAPAVQMAHLRIALKQPGSAPAPMLRTCGLWIYVAKAVLSSLHQMVKFKWDRQEIVVHGDENLSAYNDTVFPFIEAEDDKVPWVYQTFETVSVEKVPKGECNPGPKLPSVSIMVLNEILKNGFVPGKGLGSSLQGIVHPVCPRESFGTFGLGFTLTGKDVKRAKNLKRKVWSLPKPVPYISKSFVKPGAAKRPISSVPKPVVNFDEELIKRFQSLFDEDNMVEIREETEYDEEAEFEEISRELKHFEGKPKPNLNETEAINLGYQDNVRETKISVHLEPQIKEEIIKALFEYKDVFAWSYDDMPGLNTDFVVHKLPIDPAFAPVKQKLRKFNTDMSVKIKEEITKQLGEKIIRVTQYPTWLANVVPVPKKDGKTRVGIDYHDLNKAIPKDNFPFPNIYILIDNYAKHEIGSFVDCYAGYHQILMDEEDAEKTAFIMP